MYITDSGSGVVARASVHRRDRVQVTRRKRNHQGRVEFQHAECFSSRGRGSTTPRGDIHYCVA